MSFADRTPQSANEGYLRQIAGGGENPFDREPQSANEYWLKQIAENGGGGGGLPPYEASDDRKFLGLVRQMAVDGETPSVAPAWVYGGYGFDLSETYSNNVSNMMQTAIGDALANNKSYSVQFSEVALTQSDIANLAEGVSVMQNGGYAVGRLLVFGSTAYLPFSLGFAYGNGFSVQSVVPYYSASISGGVYYLRITTVNTVTIVEETTTTATTVMVEIIGGNTR